MQRATDTRKCTYLELIRDCVGADGLAAFVGKADIFVSYAWCGQLAVKLHVLRFVVIELYIYTVISITIYSYISYIYIYSHVSFLRRIFTWSPLGCRSNKFEQLVDSVSDWDAADRVRTGPAAPHYYFIDVLAVRRTYCDIIYSGIYM